MTTRISLSHLLTHLRRELPRLQATYHVQTLEVFGSYVRDEQRVGSDLDLLVTFTETPSLWKFIELEQHLSDLLGIQVDLVMRDSLKPQIGLRILHEALQL